jgi:hypothetical protein
MIAGLRILRNPVAANSVIHHEQTVLNYEFQMKEGIRAVRKGNVTAVAALEAAMIGQEIRGLHSSQSFRCRMSAEPKPKQDSEGLDEENQRFNDDEQLKMAPSQGHRFGEVLCIGASRYDNGPFILPMAQLELEITYELSSSAELAKAAQGIPWSSTQFVPGVSQWRKDLGT